MLDQSQGWHNWIGWGKGNPSDQALPPPKAETEHRQVVEDTSEEEAGALYPLSWPPYPLMDYDMRGAGEWEPTENPNRLTGLADPFILDSLGSGMDGTNQKCKSRKRSRERDRTATTRTRVGGVLSVSYHSCSGKDPQLSKGPPTARITVANPPFTQWIALILFQSTKFEMGEKEKKEVFIEEALHLK